MTFTKYITCAVQPYLCLREPCAEAVSESCTHMATCSQVKFRAFIDEVGEPDADVETGGRGSREDVETGQRQQQQQRPTVAPQQAPAFQERAVGEGASHYASHVSYQQQQQQPAVRQQEMVQQLQHQQRGERGQQVLYPPNETPVSPSHQPNNEVGVGMVHSLPLF